MIKLGSQSHKELFCHSFINSYQEYTPELLPWPNLDPISLERLRSIPFWQEALYTERKAGIMVSAFARTIEDPLLREAITLQGKEETRHGRLIAFLIKHYQIPIKEPEIAELPSNIELAFTDFGFEECLDSFFAFGMFEIARLAQYLPQPFFDIFDPIMNEEARHIVFFVNWVTYLQIFRGRGLPIFRSVHAFSHYARALAGLVKTFAGVGDREEQAFSATGAKTFMDDLTPELFFSVCIQENTKRMSQFDPALLQPRLLPRLSNLALSVVKLLPQKSNPVNQVKGSLTH